MDITLKQAEIVIAAALVESRNLGTKMNIAVVDTGMNLIAFAREDGAWLGSIDIAIKKAKTAKAFNMPTGDVGELSQPGGDLWGIEHSNDGLITFPGGCPIYNDSEIVGAIGVSGASVTDDAKVAYSGADAFLTYPGLA